MEELTDESKMIFGEHKGTKMKDLSPGYLDWLRDRAWISDWSEVQRYIEKNGSVIDKELEELETE